MEEPNKIDEIYAAFLSEKEERLADEKRIKALKQLRHKPSQLDLGGRKHE